MPLDVASEEQFYKVINSIYERHSTTLMTMAKGAHEIRSMLGHDTMTFAEQDDIHRCLDEFYMSRIGVRMLIGQYLTLRSSTAEDIEEGRIGQVKCAPSVLLQ
jgi:pyruvate dehydrogenase kinase 2/3/4